MHIVTYSGKMISDKISRCNRRVDLSRLLSYRSCLILRGTLCILIILKFGLAPQSAHAGHWNMHVSGTGSASATGKKTVNWTAPPDGVNSVTLAGLSIGQGGSSPSTASAQISATITGTWVPDSASDPAPPNVVLYRTSTAYANHSSSGPNNTSGPPLAGTADNGVGNNDTTANSGVGVVTGHDYPPQSGSSFTMALSLSASASATPGPFGVDPLTGLLYSGTCTCSAGVGGATVSIHAQPYNFRQKASPLVNNSTGSLGFAWEWSSTDGNLADLTSCTVYEYITFSGDGIAGVDGNGVPAWAPWAPPVGPTSAGVRYGYANPTIAPDVTKSVNYGNARIGTADDEFKAPALIHPNHGPKTTWTGHQGYYFDDSATGEIKTKIPSPKPTDDEDDIVRAVSLLSSGAWMYSVTTRGVTATINPLP
jgi:hypothetical protein